MNLFLDDQTNQFLIGVILIFIGILFFFIKNMLSRRVVKMYARDANDSEKIKTYQWEKWRIIFIAVFFILIGFIVVIKYLRT
jgi:ABC-type Fe3+ transport system permease subunit